MRSFVPRARLAAGLKVRGLYTVIKTRRDFKESVTAIFIYSHPLHTV